MGELNTSCKGSFTLLRLAVPENVINRITKVVQNLLAVLASTTIFQVGTKDEINRLGNRLCHLVDNITQFYSVVVHAASPLEFAQEQVFLF